MSNKIQKADERPWGRFDVLSAFKVEKTFISEKKGVTLEKDDTVVKRIQVKPQEMLSYQSHLYRDEVWVIVQGNGIVTLDGMEMKVEAGKVIEIPKYRKHRIYNTELKTPLVFVEVSLGKFDENDIKRYSDKYNR